MALEGSGTTSQAVPGPNRSPTPPSSFKPHPRLKGGWLSREHAGRAAGGEGTVPTSWLRVGLCHLQLRDSSSTQPPGRVSPGAEDLGGALEPSDWGRYLASRAFGLLIRKVGITVPPGVQQRLPSPGAPLTCWGPQAGHLSLCFPFPQFPHLQNEQVHVPALPAESGAAGPGASARRLGPEPRDRWTRPLPSLLPPSPHIHRLCPVFVPTPDTRHKARPRELGGVDGGGGRTPKRLPMRGEDFPDDNDTNSDPRTPPPLSPRATVTRRPAHNGHSLKSGWRTDGTINGLSTRTSTGSP